MKVPANFVITITGSTDQTDKVYLGGWDTFTYLMRRLVNGEEVALEAFRYYGLEVTVKAGPTGLGGEPSRRLADQ